MALHEVGISLDYGNSAQVWRKIFKKMGIIMAGAMPKGSQRRQNGAEDDGTQTERKIAVCSKFGVPASDVADDAPTGFGDLCYDYENNDVYRCTAFTDISTFTWTKIAD